jgi:hypothetical protein
VPFTDTEVYKTQKTYRQEELRVNKHNEAQWKYIRQHLQDHRKKVAETGPELAIEMVIGHGGCGSALTENECEGKGDYRWDGNACGVWGASFYTDDSLDRAEFHAGNYKAANKNVCDWVVIDSSCFSGFTAKAVDELNNLQTARCDKAPADACANHAAWENDTALTTVSPGKLSKWSDAQRLRGYIREILEEEAFLLKRNGSVYYPRIAQKLRSEGYTEKGCYSDRGYMMDVPPPPDHVRQGY